jgi:hypothetical protein
MPSVDGFDDTVPRVGYGVHGATDSPGGIGVLGDGTGESTSEGFFGAGVKGESNNGLGVLGRSYNSWGVLGDSIHSHGVYGNSDFGNGVYGKSGFGNGVSGFSNNYPMQV